MWAEQRPVEEFEQHINNILLTLKITTEKEVQHSINFLDLTYNKHFKWFYMQDL